MLILNGNTSLKSIILLMVVEYVASETSIDVWHQGQASIKINPRLNQLNNVYNQTFNISPQDKHSSQQNSTNLTNSDTGNASNGLCDFGGRHIKVAITPQPPFVGCSQNFYGDWFCNGSNIEVIQVLEKRLNFKAEWIVLADSHFNEVDPTRLKQKSKTVKDNINETLKTSGIFGLVSTGRAFMSANGVMKTLDRNAYNLIVSEPFDSFKLHFLLSKSVHDHDHIFVKPFELRAWIAILVSATLMVPIFYFINTTSAFYSTKDDRVLNRISIWQCFNYWLKSKLYDKTVLCISKRRRKLQKRRPSSSTSNDSSLDREINLMIETKGALMGTKMHLLRPIPSKSGVRRKKRLLKHQWSLERKKAKRMSRIMRQSGFFKIAYIIWYVVASLANQGGETEDLPQATSTRILIAFWWLYLIVICAIHSGILTAILTFPKQIDFIRTLDDYFNLNLRDRMEIKLAVDKYSELAHLLSDTDNLHKSPLQMLQKESVPLYFVDFDRHRQRILDDIQLGHRALIEERSIVNQIITQEYMDSKQSKCLFKASRFAVDVIPMSIILSKQMPINCIQSINSILKKIMITGLAQKWRRKYDSPGNDCLNSVVINAGDVDKIELKHVILAFWLLLTCYVIGMLFLIGEIIWLFMIEGEDEEGLADSLSTLSTSSSSSLSSSASTDSSGNDMSQVQLGHRRAKLEWSQRNRSIRTMQTNRLGSVLRRRLKRQHQQQNKQVASLQNNSTPNGKQPIFGPRTKNQRLVPIISLNLVEDQDSYKQRPNPLIEVDNVNIDASGDLYPISENKVRRAEERKRSRLAKAAERRSRRLNRTVDFFRRIHGGKIYSDKMKNRVRRASEIILTRFANMPTQDNQNSTIRHRTGRVAPK